MKLKTYLLHQNQTFLDVSLALYGTALYAFDLAVLNGRNIEDELLAGTELFYNTQWQTERTILVIYANNKTIPATAFTKENKQILERLEGISIWGITIDFVVSHDA